MIFAVVEFSAIQSAFACNVFGIAAFYFLRDIGLNKAFQKVFAVHSEPDYRVMEHIYQPLCGRSIDSECLKNIRKDKQRIEHLIEAAFAELFFKTENIRPLTGQNYLVGSMIYKYVDKILEEDAKLSPFTYIKSEKLIRSSICLNDGTSVFLKGFIDRTNN